MDPIIKIKQILKISLIEYVLYGKTKTIAIVYTPAMRIRIKEGIFVSLFTKSNNEILFNIYK